MHVIVSTDCIIQAYVVFSCDQLCIYICGWVGGWVASLFTQVGFRIVPPPCWWVVQVIDMYVQVLSPAKWTTGVGV